VWIEEDEKKNGQSRLQIKVSLFIYVSANIMLKEREAG
jgi:hypothetical protein